MSDLLTRATSTLAAVAMLCGCYALRPAKVPLGTLAYPGTTDDRSCLLVLLPGRADRPGDFERRGFTSILRAEGFELDALAADLHLGYYRNRTAVERLQEDVISPARARGYRKIWLVGISAGGTGSLIYSRLHPDELEGILLIAPFLGSDSMVAEVEAAGGLAGWSPDGSSGKQFEREMWERLKQLAEAPAPPLRLYLGYGTEDEFSQGHRILAAALPPDHVIAVPGGHDWEPWREIWRTFLRSGALDEAGCGDPAARREPEPAHR